ncbi:hypothetical protein INT48_007415 [Thamnidium elegans]|uniref:Uncharacterized protein n=1 Tax=Thamnidium elegans TaxID=101142 RepID=A0A8H7SNN0_9FUNG|nr:hypothetical protein INT48_007415 [Thamnidium elegans]
MKKDEEDNDIEKVNVNKGEIDIFNRRLSKLKGRLKYMLYTHEKERISKQDFDLAGITDKEMQRQIVSKAKPFDLFSKEGKLISSLPSAIKDKAAVFGSIFDIKSIKEYCNSRRLTFIRTPPTTQKKPGKTVNHQQKMKELEKTAEELNKEPQDRKKSFNLEETDRHIKNLKKERNLLSHEGQRNMMATEIKIMKQRRWTDFKHIEILRREFKETRRKAYFFRITTLADNVQDVSRNHEVSDDFIDSLLTNIKDLKFSGTDYGLQTMSVTVGVSLKMFNAYLNLYNKFNPEHPL